MAEVVVVFNGGGASSAGGSDEVNHGGAPAKLGVGGGIVLVIAVDSDGQQRRPRSSSGEIQTAQRLRADEKRKGRACARVPDGLLLERGVPGVHGVGPGVGSIRIGLGVRAAARPAR